MTKTSTLVAISVYVPLWKDEFDQRFNASCRTVYPSIFSVSLIAKTEKQNQSVEKKLVLVSSLGVSSL